MCFELQNHTVLSWKGPIRIIESYCLLLAGLPNKLNHTTQSVIQRLPEL